MASLAEQLASVQEAIAKVESGVQSITDDDGNVITYPPLKTLYDREERLLRRVEREARGHIKVAEF